jgi:hypothetical protein
VISSFTIGQPFDLFPTELASPTKASLIYETFAGSLPLPSGGNGTFDVYRAARSEAGWATVEHISRTPTDGSWALPGGVSVDHAYSFANENDLDLLRTPTGEFQMTGIGSKGTEPHAQGRYISEGGAHIIFTTGASPLQSQWCPCSVTQLEENAPSKGTGAVYDRNPNGQTHVISLLPPDETPGPGQQAFYKGSSKNAGSVAFEIGGVLYVRVRNGLENEATEEVATGSPAFAGLSDDGRYLFYVEAGTIHRFDTTTETTEDVNPVGEAEVVNISADGSHVYLISKQLLDGSQGVAGEPNLYVWNESSPQYIATVAPSDLVKTSGKLAEVPALTAWTKFASPLPTPPYDSLAGPGDDSSRTTPDGSVLVFESKAQLTTYENEGHTEIYRYDSQEPGVTCLSCSPVLEGGKSGARLQELNLVNAATVIHNLSSDGDHVFFETDEALVEGDTNGANDIYEWQKEGAGSSVSLISTGRSPAYPIAEGIGLLHYNPMPNVLMSITPSGSDVFFMAEEPLVAGAGENGTQGVYDARVGGGIAVPPNPTVCVEEGCKLPQGNSESPLSTSPSETINGSGNLRPRKRNHCARKHKQAKRRCGKGHGGKALAGVSSISGSPGDGPAGEEVVPSGAADPAAAAGQGSEPRTISGPVSAVTGSVENFGIERFEGNLTDPRAGMHPDLSTIIEFTHFIAGGTEEANAALEELKFDLPAGFVGNPRAVPTCSMGDFVAFANCSPDTEVGISTVRLGRPVKSALIAPVYNLAPAHSKGQIARLGFLAFEYPVFIDVSVRTAGDYGVTATIQDPPGLGVIVRAKTTLWGNPANPVHDEERFTTEEKFKCVNPSTCKVPAPGRPSGIEPGDRKAFLINPSACQPMPMFVSVRSYQLPGEVFEKGGTLPDVNDCTGLPFSPTFSAEPTSHAAGAPTGLETRLVIPQHLGEEEPATATMREARVTLPAGMQVAAGAANWIGTCSDAQVGYREEVGTDCPDSSKLGTATIVSPALAEPIEGTVYQRAPQPGHQLGLWLTADALGMHIKLPGELEPDKQTGRLTAVFKDLPQVPVEEIDLNVWGGPRAPLQNPDHCGTFTTDFSFSPHSNDPAATGHSDMQITEGCNQPFSPTLHAGVTEPVAGKYSPLVFDLTRADGDQALRGFELHLPDGELAKIKGVPLCSDAAAASASCPQGSRIGSLQATTGPGPDPFTLPEAGKAQPAIFLAGPYQGAPFSIVSEVPAQAGPFDLGTLAVRSALNVEPETGRAVVKADPLPQFFEGVGIAYRNLHAVIDRPEFNLNPTDCREMAVTADVASTQGTVAHPQARFQVDGCKALGFKPKLTLKLKGGTKRASYPALTAILKARKGDANIAFTSVALPHSEFLAQEHIGTICTRVQFAADTCPKKSVYGKAKAFTPLLDKPLSGPVYLRSSNHPLPDVVAKLGGQLEIDLVGRVDSVHGGIRTTFESVPDAPVSKFVLQMKGGAKGLFTNSTDICRGSHRATVAMRAQNGRAVTLRPALQSSGCGKKKLGKHKKHH